MTEMLPFEIRRRYVYSRWQCGLEPIDSEALGIHIAEEIDGIAIALEIRQNNIACMG
jgi:hypothetical protein